MVTDELELNWCAQPTGRCYCGCGRHTYRYFARGHDSQYAAKLLAELRGNAEVKAVIQRLANLGDTFTPTKVSSFERIRRYAKRCVNNIKR